MNDDMSRVDKRLQEVGRVGLEAVAATDGASGVVFVPGQSIADSVRQVLKQDLPQSKYPFGVFFHVYIHESPPAIAEGAFLFLEPQFLVNAQSMPVETVARLAAVGSAIRDYQNGRFTIDPDLIPVRMMACEAESLRLGQDQARPGQPEVLVPQLLRGSGLASLPDGVWYEAVPIIRPPDPRAN